MSGLIPWVTESAVYVVVAEVCCGGNIEQTHDRSQFSRTTGSGLFAKTTPRKQTAFILSAIATAVSRPPWTCVETPGLVRGYT